MTCVSLVLLVHLHCWTPFSTQSALGTSVREDTGPGHLVVSESTMNSSAYQSILESKCEATCLTAKTRLRLGHAAGE